MITSILIGVLLFILKATRVSMNIGWCDMLPLVIIMLSELLLDFRIIKSFCCYSTDFYKGVVITLATTVMIAIAISLAGLHVSWYSTL